MSSTTPISVTNSGTLTYLLDFSLIGSASGEEILTVKPNSNSIFDSKGDQVDLSLTQSNTILVNDKTGPKILELKIDDQNGYVDLSFSEGIYGSVSPTTSVASSSFIISQVSGPTYKLSIDNISQISGGNLLGGEN